MVKRINFVILVYVCSLGTLVAQDIHLLQFNASPQNLNPSQTGLFDGDWRFVGNYRNQWKAIPVPFNTYSIAADTRIMPTPPVLKPMFKNAVPGVGLLVNSDIAGDSKLQTTQVYLSISYIKQLSKDSTHFLSFAIQPGFTSKGFNTSDLSFDSQFDGNAYNPNLGTGENFSTTSFGYFDVGTGLTYAWKKNSRTRMNVGFSVFHLNTPEQTFFDNKNIELDVKTNFNARVHYPVAERIDIEPSFLYQQQGKFKEFTIGLFGKYYLHPIYGMETAVSLGAYNRAKDAWVAAARLHYRSFIVGVSYDINSSNLNAATNNRGAFELSVIYIYKKIKPFIAKHRVCPIYM